ncbi:hypothetical protein ACWC98_10795 [Streptomyces goshikiensis]|uniref:hypothetical protein n=1 Tax=Streptomyces goshikiensis TaxID=1942 RepID=UPI00332EEEE2
MTERKPRKDRTEVTAVLPAETRPGRSPRSVRWDLIVNVVKHRRHFGEVVR